MRTYAPYHEQVLVQYEMKSDTTSSGLYIAAPPVAELWTTVVAVGKGVEGIAVGDQLVYKDTHVFASNGKPVALKAGYTIDKDQRIAVIHRSQILAIRSSAAEAIRPYDEQLLLQLDTPHTRTASGLHVSSFQDEEAKVWGRVIEVGRGVEDVAVGARIAYRDTYIVDSKGQPLPLKAKFFLSTEPRLAVIHRSQVLAIETSA